MPDPTPLTVLCIASYEKGQAFMRECKRQGCRTLLLTSKSLENVAWPRESLDDIFFIEDVDHEWEMKNVIAGVSFLARTVEIDRIVALDDFDVEKAAALREHLRVPGMGDTTARYFRDKLAMRMLALEKGLPVPPFASVVNDAKVSHFLQVVPPPYVLKPRTQAGAIGIQRIDSAQEVWNALHALGDQRSFFLLEKFIAGDIFHVDSIVENRNILFAVSSKYGAPPLEVSQQGRVFVTRNIKRKSSDDKSLQALNKQVLSVLGLVRGISHSEYIKGEDGTFYFLETSARVAGAHIAEMLEGATGLNLWAEWAKLETAPLHAPYTLPKTKNDYAGLVVSLAKQDWPDLSGYTDPEIFWRMKKQYHAGVAIQSADIKRIDTLLGDYAARFYQDFFKTLPAPEKAGH